MPDEAVVKIGVRDGFVSHPRPSDAVPRDDEIPETHTGASSFVLLSQSHPV